MQPYVWKGRVFERPGQDSVFLELASDHFYGAYGGTCGAYNWCIMGGTSVASPVVAWSVVARPHQVLIGISMTGRSGSNWVR